MDKRVTSSAGVPHLHVKTPLDGQDTVVVVVA